MVAKLQIENKSDTVVLDPLKFVRELNIHFICEKITIVKVRKRQYFTSNCLHLLDVMIMCKNYSLCILVIEAYEASLCHTFSQVERCSLSV